MNTDQINHTSKKPGDEATALITAFGARAAEYIETRSEDGFGWYGDPGEEYFEFVDLDTFTENILTSESFQKLMGEFITRYAQARLSDWTEQARAEEADDIERRAYEKWLSRPGEL